MTTEREAHTQYYGVHDVEDMGDSGYFHSIKFRRRDGEEVVIGVSEDGDGMLVIHVSATEALELEVKVDRSNEGLVNATDVYGERILVW